MITHYPAVKTNCDHNQFTTMTPSWANRDKLNVENPLKLSNISQFWVLGIPYWIIQQLIRADELTTTWFIHFDHVINFTVNLKYTCQNFQPTIQILFPNDHNFSFHHVIQESLAIIVFNIRHNLTPCQWTSFVRLPQVDYQNI